MISTARLVVARRGGRDVVIEASSVPPISIRPAGGRILIASSAAAPVGGDVLRLDIVVEAGATADVGSVGAMMLWPGDEPSSLRVTVDLADGAHLRWRPEPTISVFHSRHASATLVRLASSATCEVIEEIVLGRTGEPSGWLRSVLRIERDGRPLVHHAETFGPDIAGAGSVVSVGGARHVLTGAVVGGPEDPALEPGRAAAPAARRRSRSAATRTSRTDIDSVGAAAWLPVADDAAVVLGVGLDRPAVLDRVRRIGPELLDPTRSSGRPAHGDELDAGRGCVPAQRTSVSHAPSSVGG